MADKYLRGAFVAFTPTFVGALPNVIVFQFNPETIVHTWTQAEAVTTTTGAQANPLAVKGTPGETFGFTIAMDARDLIADGSKLAPVVAQTGVYPQLAALEMLLYPTGMPGTTGGAGGLVGAVSSALASTGLSIGASSGPVDRTVPESQVPTVLFVWGPGRIVPVRLTGLTITEKLYDAARLNPTYAEAQVSLRVMTLEEMKFVTGPIADVARVAYVYTQGLRQALATTNLADAAETILGMLPV